MNNDARSIRGASDGFLGKIHHYIGCIHSRVRDVPTSNVYNCKADTTNTQRLLFDPRGRAIYFPPKDAEILQIAATRSLDTDLMHCVRTKQQSLAGPKKLA